LKCETHWVRSAGVLYGVGCGLASPAIRLWHEGVPLVLTQARCRGAARPANWP